MFEIKCCGYYDPLCCRCSLSHVLEKEEVSGDGESDILAAVNVLLRTVWIVDNIC